MTTSARSSKVVRVLVVDDSVVVRRVVGRALEGDPSLELAGAAANGRIALEKLTRLRPDIIVLDLEMPVMDGFDTLRSLQLSHPDIPVIVFSHLTDRGAKATLEAMDLGASGFVTKPSAAVNGLDGHEVRDGLVPLIKALAASSSIAGPALPGAVDAVGDGASEDRGIRQALALVVAASTGGPNALAVVVAALPADLAVPVLVVQHMPAIFTKHLAERLDQVGPLRVVEAAADQPVAPGQIYIAPGGRHMGVSRDRASVVLDIHDGPPENSCRPSADVLFRSAAKVYGHNLLGLVLTGMGRDGCGGAQLIRAAGGMIIAQDQATSVIGSMPAAVADAGLANAVVPLDRIGPELARRLGRRAMP